MKLVIVICVLSISGLVATFDIEISKTHVAIKNDTFFPTKTVLECKSNTQKHVYCCWRSPQLEECKCDEKECPLNGVTVSSDKRKCSVTIEHQDEDANANAGRWTCQLFNFQGDVKTANASTKLFIINVNEVPLIRQTTPAIEFAETPHVTKEAQFECVSSTKAPFEKYQWYFRNHSIAFDGKNIRLNLSREDFNQSLKCIIKKGLNATYHVSDSVAQKDLILNMNPKVISIKRKKEGSYRLLVESWPMPNFIRVSSVEECNNQCVIYKLVKGKYVVDKSPYMKPENNFVQDIILEEQVYGAKMRINLILNIERLTNLSEIFVSVGNDLNVANAKIDLLQYQGPPGYQLTSDSKLDQSSFVVTIIIVAVTTVSIVVGIILLVLFRQEISESFKCGVYLVPHDDHEEIGNNDEDKKNGKVAIIAPETEF